MALALAWAAGCAAPQGGQPGCRRVALLDQGRPVVGAEDVAVDAAGGRLFISAYDRLDPLGPAPHGLYVAPLAALDGAAIEVRDVLAEVGRADWRPHGIAYAEGRLAAVVRRYGPDGRAAGALVLEESARGWRLAEDHADPRLCALNDVAFAPDGALIATLDRGLCDGETGEGGLLVRLGGAFSTLRARLGFANGAALDAEGRVWVGETRAGRISADGRRWAMPGAPDNLTSDGDRLIVALHPDLLAFARHRHRWPWSDRAPSRIVAVDPETGRAATLFDDPSGRMFSGATVGALAGGRLVLGGIREPGLLVCEGLS